MHKITNQKLETYLDSRRHHRETGEWSLSRRDDEAAPPWAPAGIYATQRHISNDQRVK